jgi:crotonobetainyl-CoA:carnitine CoA-transferase CaiB-like acyl-CoA transferase
VLNRAGVPCGPVNDVKGVFDDLQIQSQDMAIDVPRALSRAGARPA